MTKIQIMKTIIAAFAIVFCLTPNLVAAQNLFTPAFYVNNTVVTKYELNQRVRLLEVLGSTGDLEKEARERLIGERLQLQAATRAGISMSQDAISAGIDEFAARTQLTGTQFLSNISSQGVAADSFRDFVHAGLAWRELVRSKFLSKANITDAEIDREIRLEGTRGSVQVLISEIFLPTNTPKNTEITRELAPQIARLTTVAEFSDAARRFSAGPSRDRGGVVPDWVPINNLPPNVRSVMLTMRPGQVTDPIEIPNALALFQLRARQETVAPTPRNPVMEYAAYYIPGGRSDAGMQRASELRGRVDTCDDLYGIAKNQSVDVLDRDALPLSEVPQDVAFELAKLDVGEVSTALTRANGETLVFLMLCARGEQDDSEASREIVRRSLVSSRLASLADAYLDELRANATIRTR